MSIKTHVSWYDTKKIIKIYINIFNNSTNNGTQPGFCLHILH